MMAAMLLYLLVGSRAGTVGFWFLVCFRILVDVG